MRSWRYAVPLFAGGTVATVLPAVRAHGWTVDVRPGAGPWLAAVVAAVLGMGILNTIARVCRDRQETRRKEIELHGMEVLITAFARAIDATHTMARNLPPAKEMTEAARVRDSARKIAADLVPAIEKLGQLPRPAPSPERLEAGIGTEPAQLPDPVRAN